MSSGNPDAPTAVPTQAGPGGAVERLATTQLPTRWATFRCTAYRSPDGVEHLAVSLGRLDGAGPAGAPEGAAPLVRLHSECLTGDVFASGRCDCGAQLHQALERIAAAGAGVVVYLRGHEGRGIGLGEKIRAYELQEAGLDTVDANTALGLPIDAREYGTGARILLDLGVRAVRLLTNNPDKCTGLEAHGLRVVERIAVHTPPTTHNRAYLAAKQSRMGHLLELDG